MLSNQGTDINLGKEDSSSFNNFMESLDGLDTRNRQEILGHLKLNPDQYKRYVENFNIADEDLGKILSIGSSLDVQDLTEKLELQKTKGVIYQRIAEAIQRLNSDYTTNTNVLLDDQLSGQELPQSEKAIIIGKYQDKVAQSLIALYSKGLKDGHLKLSEIESELESLVSNDIVTSEQKGDIKSILENHSNIEVNKSDLSTEFKKIQEKSMNKLGVLTEEEKYIIQLRNDMGFDIWETHKGTIAGLYGKLQKWGWSLDKAFIKFGGLASGGSIALGVVAILSGGGVAVAGHSGLGTLLAASGVGGLLLGLKLYKGKMKLRKKLYNKMNEAAEQVEGIREIDQIIEIRSFLDRGLSKKEIINAYKEKNITISEAIMKAAQERNLMEEIHKRIVKKNRAYK